MAVAAAAVLWQAAALTTRQTDQSAHLYELHRLKVEVLTRELQPPPAQGGGGGGGKANASGNAAAAPKQPQQQHQQRVAAAMAAKTSFELEYALVKEYMALNAATANGCFTLLPECRVTRSHALTAATVLLPALLRELASRPGAAALLR